MKHLTMEKDENQVCIVTVDSPDTSVNTLSSIVFDEMEKVVEQVVSDPCLKGLVIISGKEDSFIAGADLDELKAMKNREETEAYVQRGNRLISRLEAWEKPVVCAINGACMGGGLELALACDIRIASDFPGTVFALPEVQLGLFPAGGGTHRLPQLIGLPEALPLILSGKQVRVKKARKLGLIDEVVHPYALKDAAVKTVLTADGGKPEKNKVKRSLANKVLEKYSLGKKLIFYKARKGVMKQTRGLYPAPLAIIDSVCHGVENGIEQGIKSDIKRFGALARSKEATALINLFFAMNRFDREGADRSSVPVKKLAILGAGLMGHGIAGVSTELVDTILLKDTSLEAAAKGIGEVKKGLSLMTRSGSISEFEKEVRGAKLIPCNSYSAFKGTDLVIEAVFEDLDLKRRILEDVENATGPKTIFASNTSSLPIGDIAKGCRRPENVIGMHYFSPVRSMPLLEIIITDQTADWVVDTAIAFGQSQGKTCIVVKDGPAFYTTRILTMMLNEAMLLVEEGVDVRTIDNAMTGFGYPVGPMTLVDEVGFDVGVHVAKIMAKIMAKSVADRNIKTSVILERLYDKGFSGRKNRKGFYTYNGRKGKKPVNRDINKILGIRPRKKVDTKELVSRISLAMVNEAVLCLEEGIISTPRDGDIGAILGLGFPPFRGGPFRYIDSRTPSGVLAEMETLEQKFGSRFAPATLLKEKGRQSTFFY